MSTDQTQVNSLGRLAHLALQQAEWPSDVNIQARSLAALLGKIDRGQELGWLASRPGAQVSLARVLGVGVEALTRGLRAADTVSPGDRRLLRLRALPAARPLDLWNEGLPPGLPRFETSLGATATWWVAASGSGRTLAGSWLRARGRARFEQHSGTGFRDTEPSTPLFVEIDESIDPSLSPAARPGLIVAAPFEPPPGSGFERLEAADLADEVEPLLAWARARLPGDSALDPEQVRGWLVERVANAEIGTFGAVLGLIGLFDEPASRALETLSFERLPQRFVERAFADSIDPSLPHAAFLRKNGYEALIGLCERSLVDSDRLLTEARSIDEWLALVPHELERAVDVDWVRLSLRGVDSGVRPSELERAAKRLPPGAYRLVTGLEQAGLLRRLNDDRLKLEPPWLCESLERKALSALSARSPVEWGEALLRPHAAAALAEVLLERSVEQGTSVLEPVLDLAPSDEPEYAATIDVALRAAGLARLLGADVSQETLDALWSEAAGLFVDLNTDAPRPGIEPLVSPMAPALRRMAGRRLFARGTLYLAALSVSEAVGARRARVLTALSPWHATEPPAGLAAVYDEIAVSLKDRPPWYASALRLIGRLRSIVGNVRDADHPHELEWPAQVVEEVEHGVLSLSSFERSEPSLEAVLAVGETRRIGLERLAEAVWSAWDDAGRPERPRLFERESAWAETLFRFAPDALLEQFLEAQPASELAFEQLKPSAFRALGFRNDVLSERAALAAMPPVLFETLVRSAEARALLAQNFDLVWRRATSAAALALNAELDSKRAARADVLEALLLHAPDQHVPRAIEELADERRLFALGEDALAAVLRALSRWSSTRASGWRAAYANLRRIERERRRNA